MTATNAIGAGAIPTQHYAPKGGCGHHGMPTPMPMPAPGPLPMPHPEPMPMPHPDGWGTPPAAPAGMYGLAGGTTSEIARGILELYDRDRSGTITAEEAVRVQRDHGGFNGGMMRIPSKYGFPSTTVDVFAMTKLLVKADTNHNGRVGVNELNRTLKRFDTGDHYPKLPGAPGQHVPKPGGLSGADGRLTGSEFDAFMIELGEQHVGSWQEPSYHGFRDYPSFHGMPPYGHTPRLPSLGLHGTAPAAPAGAAPPASSALPPTPVAGD